MTAYWNMTPVYNLLRPEQQAEVLNLRISPLTMHACHGATSRIPACTSMALVYTVGIGSRRVYLQYPSFEQWVALERGGFVEIWDDFGFVMDALH
jgi:hypothetical protein